LHAPVLTGGCQPERFSWRQPVIMPLGMPDKKTPALPRALFQKITVGTMIPV
jgi:hypothetical protein